jgi:hypothetical protein
MLPRRHTWAFCNGGKRIPAYEAQKNQRVKEFYDKILRVPDSRVQDKNHRSKRTTHAAGRLLK